MKKLVVTIASLLVTLGSMSPAPAAGPPGGLNVREQNVDESGSVRVHEQGTANVNVTNSSLPVTVQNVPTVQDVRVTNSPLGVSGTVSVGNLPLDASGAVRVTAPSSASRASLVAENFDIPAKGVTERPGPFIDTSACRSVTAFIDVRAQRVNSVTPVIDVSPDGVAIFGAQGATAILCPECNASQFYFLVPATSTPIVAPFVKLRFFYNNIDTPIHVNKAWLYCAA